MLALRASGGLKTGGGFFHPRVSALTKNVAKTIGFTTFSKKSDAVAAVAC